MLADAAGTRRPQERIGKRVGNRIRIGVAGEAGGMRDLDPAKYQPPAQGEPVRVVTQSGPAQAATCSMKL